MEKGVKGSDECCISICDFSPQPFDILRRHLPVFSVSTSLVYQLSLDQLSQLSASACLCLKEQVRHLTALCYCVSTMWTKSNWNLISDCLLFNFKLNFESNDLHSEDCHDIGGKKKKKVTWTEAAAGPWICLSFCALSKVLKFPPVRPNTKLSAYLSYKEASHFSSRCFISTATSCDQHIDWAHCHKGHFISVMRAAGQESFLGKSESTQCESDCAGKRPSSVCTHTKKIK